MVKAFYSLEKFYDDLSEQGPFPNQAEFAAYSVLLNLGQVLILS